jgi:hypothetical protein
MASVLVAGPAGAADPPTEIVFDAVVTVHWTDPGHGPMAGAMIRVSYYHEGDIGQGFLPAWPLDATGTVAITGAPRPGDGSAPVLLDVRGDLQTATVDDLGCTRYETWLGSAKGITAAATVGVDLETFSKGLDIHCPEPTDPPTPAPTATPSTVPAPTATAQPTPTAQPTEHPGPRATRRPGPTGGPRVSVARPNPKWTPNTEFLVLLSADRVPTDQPEFTDSQNGAVLGVVGAPAPTPPATDLRDGTPVDNGTPVLPALIVLLGAATVVIPLRLRLSAPVRGRRGDR